MNTIMSILILQAESLKDQAAASALEGAGNRVQSMMLLYDKLYQASDYKEISSKDYIPSLVDEVLVNFPNSKSVKIKVDVDDFILEFDA